MRRGNCSSSGSRATVKISAKYLPKLHTEATIALDGLKKHFGKQSPLTLIRNRFSFHYYDEKDLVEQSFQDIPADDSVALLLVKYIRQLLLLRIGSWSSLLRRHQACEPGT